MYETYNIIVDSDAITFSTQYYIILKKVKTCTFSELIINSHRDEKESDMSYPASVGAIVCYIEAHMKEEKFNYEELERRVGFSISHIRDLSNVDIFHTMEETNEIYGFGAKALGREFFFLGRDEDTTKEEFIDFIKRHIDEGYPCIALGICGQSGS